MRGMAFIRVGGTIALVYGVYHTSAHLADTWGTPEFPAAAGEEAGGWAGGLLGSRRCYRRRDRVRSLRSRRRGVRCRGFLGGLLFGAVLGTAGAAGGHYVGETLGRTGSSQRLARRVQAVKESTPHPASRQPAPQAIRNDYTWLPGTPANLRLLTTNAAIPAGFTKVT